MRIAFFAHSFISDWNHGNAHFLRGIASELKSRGHEVLLFEPENSWSLSNLVRAQGEGVFKGYDEFFPDLKSRKYNLQEIDLGKELDGVDLVIVHEWNHPELVRRIGKYRRALPRLRILFHDTHHRSVTAPSEMEDYDLSYYDGVLAFGKVVRDIYLEKSWIQKAWVWHEAADIRTFKPIETQKTDGDIAWIGNWGDDERTKELEEYLFKPVSTLGLRCAIHGVRYPDHAISLLNNNGIEYRGWIANYMVPSLFSRFKMTVHIPRKPYVEKLPGIPTIRPFEALSCAIPLICSPWDDCEKMFTEGEDYLMARDGKEMKKLILEVLNNQELRESLATKGRNTILQRHTCRHRVDELMDICSEIGIKIENNRSNNETRVI
ncbi:glycosyltransferase [Chitinispirillales bacterium ANBcel5]|uniref:CgeB family protein n=1 Tax=Cellulosispirillum alkaliphilum TaxID=3039283 RepID=UPI002A54E311|nr:glycosyltransferase [Chitinispirillales bacterium ANBcel5]